MLLQERALQLLQSYLTPAASATPSPVLLPRLLAAAASNTQQIRTQALHCLVKAASDPQVAVSLVSHDHFAAEPLQAFLSALVEYHAEILSDGLGFLQAVKQLLPDSGAKSW